MRTQSTDTQRTLRVFELPQPEFGTIQEVRDTPHLGGIAASALECFYVGTLISISPILIKGQMEMIHVIATRRGARLPM